MRRCEFFENMPKIATQMQTHVRRRPGLCQARPDLHDALRRRGAARQAGDRAVASARPARRSIFSTSRPPVCMSADVQQADRCSADGWWTRATRSLSSSIIWTLSRRADYILDLGPEGGDGGGTTGRLPARRRRLHSARVRIPDSISDRSSHAKTAENGINKVEMCNKTGVS